MSQDNNNGNNGAGKAIEVVAINGGTRKLGGVTGKGFMPGQSGNPSGRPKRKPVLEAIEQAMEEHPELLRKIAYTALIKTARGDVHYFKEFRDMLDGRPELRIAGKDGESIQIQVEVSIARDKLIGRLAG